MARKNQNFRRKSTGFLRRAGKTVGKALRMRYGTWKKPKIANIVKDVSFLKSVVNVEKKRIDSLPLSSIPVGQVNGNSNGCYGYDITPTINQGQTSSTRNGDSIKFTNAVIQGQFIGQSAHTVPIRYIVEIFRLKNQPAVTVNSTTYTQLYNVNPVTGAIDLMSNRNPDYYANFQRIGYFTGVVKCDQFSGQTMITTFKKVLKLNHHLRYFKDGAAITEGQLIVMIRCDSGNCSTSTASSIGNIAQTAINTGLTVSMATRFYFVDN